MQNIDASTMCVAAEVRILCSLSRLQIILSIMVSVGYHDIMIHHDMSMRSRNGGVHMPTVLAPEEPHRREREREREREMERERERDREKEREREGEREGEREREKERERESGGRDRKREKERERETERAGKGGRGGARRG